VTPPKLKEKKFRVVILEDDPYFQDLLVDVFEKSEKFTVKAKFTNIEDLVKASLNYAARSQSHPEELPDLLCLDILAGPATDLGTHALNGANVSLYLKKAGINIAVLLISSIKSENLQQLVGTQFSGYKFLQKTSRITDTEIIDMALKSIESMSAN
jgi:DNA-binding NarL/FixJ family response regulator